MLGRASSSVARSGWERARRWHPGSSSVRRHARKRRVRVLQAGEPAPGFTFRDAEGREVSLGDFAGKDVILYFYPKDDTPGCTKEACGFRDDWQDLKKLGAVVIGVSADDAASHQKFIGKYKLPFPLLSDPGNKVMKQYGAYGEKMMYGKKVVG